MPIQNLQQISTKSNFKWEWNYFDFPGDMNSGIQQNMKRLALSGRPFIRWLSEWSFSVMMRLGRGNGQCWKNDLCWCYGKIIVIHFVPQSPSCGQCELEPTKARKPIVLRSLESHKDCHSRRNSGRVKRNDVAVNTVTKELHNSLRTVWYYIPCFGYTDATTLCRVRSLIYLAQHCLLKLAASVQGQRWISPATVPDTILAGHDRDWIWYLTLPPWDLYFDLLKNMTRPVWLSS